MWPCEAGARRDRPGLARLLAQVGEGDVVVVTRLDRLARSTRDLLEVAARLRGVNAGLRSLAEPWADMTSPAGRMALTVFAGIAALPPDALPEPDDGLRAHSLVHAEASSTAGQDR